MTTERPVEPPRPGAPTGNTFDDVVLPHLDAGYQLARWILDNQHDAEDAVHDACVRALRYFRTFSGGNSRAWFLKIVRNTCYGHYGETRRRATDMFDEEQHSDITRTANPEALALQAADIAMVECALRDLPARPRELLVLRELEGLSYQELADVLGIPIGSVMSGLSRARVAFRRVLEAKLSQSGHNPDSACA